LDVVKKARKCGGGAQQSEVRFWPKADDRE
jgi:hypothetical protein